MFLLNNDGLGSGVFVQTCGYYGIATAYHVAQGVLAHSSFALYIGKRGKGRRQSEWITPAQLRHVPIGALPENAPKRIQKRGPDLSFLIIQDANLLETLKRDKPFYSLDSQRLDHFTIPQGPWAIAGCPLEDINPIKYEFEKRGPSTKVQISLHGADSFPAQLGMVLIMLTLASRVMKNRLLAVMTERAVGGFGRCALNGTERTKLPSP
jgi:hypothetical protein